MKAKKDD